MNFKDFFKISAGKIGLAVLFLLATLTLSFAFMDVIYPSAIQYIGIAILWTLSLGYMASVWIISFIFPQINGSQFALGSSLSLILIILNLIWDYVLACLIVWIFNRLKPKNSKKMPLWLKGGLWGLLVWAIILFFTLFSMLGLNIPFLGILFSLPPYFSFIAYFVIGAAVGMILSKNKKGKKR